MIPVEFQNDADSPGLKKGGVLTVVRNEVELKVRANNIPEALIVDLSGLEINDVVRISDVTMPEGAAPIPARIEYGDGPDGWREALIDSGVYEWAAESSVVDFAWSAPIALSAETCASRSRLCAMHKSDPAATVAAYAGRPRPFIRLPAPAA